MPYARRGWRGALGILCALALANAASIASASESFVQADVIKHFSTTSSLHCIDLNGDGLIDIVEGTFRNVPSPPPSTAIWWHLNLGGHPPAWDHREEWQNNSGPFYKAVGTDLDGDEDFDIVAWADGGFRWFENDGTALPSFAVSRFVDTGGGAADLALADIDNDGHLDFVAANAFSDTVTWGENDGLLPPSFILRQVFDQSSWSVAAGDLDADGDIDIISVPTFGEIRWHESDGGNPPVFSPHPILGFNDAVQLFVIDLDSDNDLDIVADRHWYENVGGSPPDFVQREFPMPAQEGQRVPKVQAAFDVEKDGDLDAVGPGFWLENIGGGPIQWALHRFAPLGFFAQPFDFDLDGYLDLVVSGPSDEGSRSLVLYRNQSGEAGVRAPGEWMRYE